MAKQAYIWDTASSTWVALGLQVPAAPYSQKFGSATVTITANPTSNTVTFAVGSFTSAPSVFVQSTTIGAVVTVTAKTSTTFTVSIAGLTSGTATFDWYAVQPSA